MTRTDVALGGYLLVCAGFGAVSGSMGFPYNFPGFFVPELFWGGLVMTFIGVTAIERAR